VTRPPIPEPVCEGHPAANLPMAVLLQHGEIRTL
jgi:hypothetical protein